MLFVRFGIANEGQWGPMGANGGKRGQMGANGGQRAPNPRCAVAHVKLNGARKTHMCNTLAIHILRLPIDR